jgi:hypothetical protein
MAVQCVDDGGRGGTDSLVEGALSLVSDCAGTGKLLRSLTPNRATFKQQARVLEELEPELGDLRVPLDQPSLSRRQTGDG